MIHSDNYCCSNHYAAIPSNKLTSLWKMARFVLMSVPIKVVFVHSKLLMSLLDKYQ